MRFDCLEQGLGACFAGYGGIICKCPAPFVLVPLLITSVLILGLARQPPLLKDDLALYTPDNAKARSELTDLQHFFQINDSDPYYFERRYELERSGYIIVTTKQDGENILTPTNFLAVQELWKEITSITVPAGKTRLNYTQLCVVAKLGVKFTACLENPLLKRFEKEPESLKNLLYPITEEGLFVGQLLGGVEFAHRSKKVVAAKALLLPYQLRHYTPTIDEVAERWELALANFLNIFDSPNIRLTWWTSETLATETARDRALLLHLLAPLFVVVTLFTITCCFVGSWVHSRPWLGLGGVISAAMAIVSSIGVLLLTGHRFTSVAYSMPFIVFSIGVDNVFILLAAWRKTPVYLNLHDRMSLTFRDAGVSITVTSLTDGLSFGVGCMTSFPSVRIFCLYAGVAVVFVYVYQLTFFAAIMAVTGRREVANRHCLTFRKVVHRVQQAGSRQLGGKHEKRQSQPPAPLVPHWSKLRSKKLSAYDWPAEHSNHALARFFRTTYASLLLNPLVRFLVIIIFVVYLGFAVWGCTQMQLGLEPSDLLPADSYGRRTLKLYEEYFTEYGSYLHVWIKNLTNVTELLERRMWVSLQKEINLYEHTEFTGYSDSWLRVFLAFVRTSGLLLTPENFVYILKNIFLNAPQYQKYARDLVFDASGTELEACRFPVHLRFVGMQNQSRAMSLFRRLAETSDLDVDVYSDFFQFAEQYDAVLPATLVNIGLAGAAVITVSLLLIPQPMAALWVSVTIVSINTGILGYMSFWGVRLDFVSMVTIVMSIGFCVDFSAHLAYHFAKERGKSGPDRLRLALYAVGTPILQSAASTILGVLFLVSVDSYVFRSFLKTVVLVIILGAFHGLVVLPVLLTLLFCRKFGEEEEEYTTGTGSSGGERHSPPRIHGPPVPQGSAFWHTQSIGSSASAKDVSVTYGSQTLPYLQPGAAKFGNNGRPKLFSPEQWNAHFVVTGIGGLGPQHNGHGPLTVQRLPPDRNRSFPPPELIHSAAINR